MSLAPSSLLSRVIAIGFGFVLFALAGCSGSGDAAPALAVQGNGAPADKSPVELLNVSCDPTRELWQALNQQFSEQYAKQTGRKVTIKQSHGGSSSQARAVNDGL